MSESTLGKLAGYLKSRLDGSSLQNIQDGKDQLTLNAGVDISLKIQANISKKNLEFSLFSPKLDRVVTFEEINEDVFLDGRLDDELKGENHVAVETDVSLALDLVERWARENGYSFTHKT